MDGLPLGEMLGDPDGETDGLAEGDTDGDSLGLSHRLLLSAPSEPAEAKPFERLEDISSKAKVRRTAGKPPHRKCLPCRSAVLCV